MFAVITVTNAFLPLLQAAPAAPIVVVSSSLGSLEKDNFIQEYAAYSSFKIALNAVTLHYAKDLADSSTWELRSWSSWQHCQMTARMGVTLMTTARSLGS